MTESSNGPDIKLSSNWQVTGLILLTVIIRLVKFILFALVVHPYRRGFFCDDESLKYPLVDPTVKGYMLHIFGLGLPIILILLIETIQSLTTSRNEKRSVIFNYGIPNWITFSYQQIGVFVFGATCSEMATSIGKFTVGRLRPYFFTVCRPIIAGNTTCDDPINQGRYVEDYTCGATSRMLESMRLSFPSGHASLAMYTMVYCAIYLQARMTWSLAKLPKLVIQFVLLMLAFYTCLSRIPDYKHHPSDVLSGAVLGATVAIVVVSAVSDLFSAQQKNETELTTNGHV